MIPSNQNSRPGGVILADDVNAVKTISSGDEMLKGSQEPPRKKIMQRISNLVERSNIIVLQAEKKLVSVMMPIETCLNIQIISNAAIREDLYPPLFSEINEYLLSIEKSFDTIEGILSRIEL